MLRAKVWLTGGPLAAIVLAASLTLAEPPKEPRRSVSASVEVASGQGPYVMAEKHPGEFTIPKGFQAVDLKYAYHDPKSDFSSDKLRPSNIYSVTQKRDYPAVTGDPNSGLPPGEYKLVVGGLPGAMGKLSYRLKPVGDDFKPIPVDDKLPPGGRIIDVLTWGPGREDRKMPATYFIQGSKVTGKINHTLPAFTIPSLRSDPQPETGSFEGTLAGNVITGTWKVKFGPWGEDLTLNDGKVTHRVCTSTQTNESRTVLNADGTLTESGKASGVTETQYDANGPKPNDYSKIEWNSSYPSKDVPGVVGTWKERKK